MTGAPLPGRASAAATLEQARRFGDCARPLGASGLCTAPIAIATARLRDDDPAHARVLQGGLLRGLGLVDCGDADAQPQAQRLVGRVLARTIADGGVTREAVIVLLTVASASALPDALARLGLAHVDVVLLRVTDGADVAGLRREAEALASARAQGRVGALGLAIDDDEPVRGEGSPLARALVVAGQLAASGHAITVVRVAMNLFETASLRDDAALAAAAAAGVAVIATRPLAPRGAALAKLVSGAPDPAVLHALAAVRKLEAEWVAGLGRAIKTGDGSDDARDLFRWGQQLARTWAAPDAALPWAQWESLRRDVIAPQVGRAAAALLSALEGDARAEFAHWWQRYGTALHSAFTAIEAALRRDETYGRVHAALRDALPEAAAALPLSRAAVFAVASRPLAAVAVTMRQPTELVDMLGLAELAPWLRPGAEAAFAAGAWSAQVAPARAPDRGP